MKRRDFLLGSTAAGVAVAAAFGAASLPWRRSLLDDPRAWVGTQFELPDGTRLVLESVSDAGSDAYSVQTRLQFALREGAAPREGSHELRSATACETLFLQPGRQGPVACINRLHLGAV